MPVSPADGPSAPHGLDLVIDFVNTLDLDEGLDALASTKGLDDWLAEHALFRANGRRARERDRRQAVELREALRALMLQDNGAAAAGQARTVLERVARRGELAAHFQGESGALLKPNAQGIAGALARLLVPVFESMLDGSWLRVKVCRAPDCRWAFYDHSRNRSGVWCEMAVCGNRAKVRTYRGRRLSRNA
jgi:predicted RNA-binding Zn ribbon-like protein